MRGSGFVSRPGDILGGSKAANAAPLQGEIPGFESQPPDEYCLRNSTVEIPRSKGKVGGFESPRGFKIVREAHTGERRTVNAMEVGSIPSLDA
jgi:hypothetical protein